MWILKPYIFLKFFLFCLLTSIFVTNRLILIYLPETYEQTVNGLVQQKNYEIII